MLYSNTSVKFDQKYKNKFAYQLGNRQAAEV